jgi:lambda family phage portal protein
MTALGFGKAEAPAPAPAPRRRMFEGAMVGRLTADWVTSGSSVDSEIWGSLRLLRNRARQLSRDNDYAAQALRTIQANVIGKGIPFQAQVKKQRGNKLDQVINDQIEQLWAKWCRARHCHTSGKLSFCDIERLAIRSVAESGEVFIRIIKQPFAGSPVPMALEVLEADWIDDRMSGRTGENGNEIRMGVEVDRWSRPVAYWFLPKHPGDYLVTGTQQANLGNPVRVPADEVIHLFVTQRPGQTRGIPWMASSIKNLHQLSGFVEAEVVRARASSALMGFITSPEGELQGDDVMDGERVSNFEPGVFKYLAPGESVTVPALNAPDGQFEPFLRAMLRGMSAGLGISYHNLSQDYSQTNYSSSRLALLEERDNWRVLQEWMIESFHQRVLETWLDLAVLSGQLQLPLYETDPERYRQVRWMPRGWSWVDPQKEITALREAEMAGYMTKAEIIAESGGDIEEVFQQRRRELDLAQELDLTFDTSSPAPSAPTGQPTNAPEQPAP